MDDSYRLLTFLHVLAVILAFGVTFAWPFLQGAAERSGTGSTRFALKLIRRVDRLVTIPGAVLVAVFGIALIFEDVTGYSDDFPAWLELSIALYIVAFAAAIAIQHRTLGRAIAVLETAPDDGPLPDEYRPLGRRLQMVGGMLGLAVIVILFLMVWKPALWD